MVMRSEKELPSLLDPENRGGVTGGEGYNFQDAYIASRIPEWLADTSFVSLLKEGMGDVDVKYVKPDAEHREFYQVKNHLVKSTECCEVLTTFYQTNRKVKGEYSKYILACTGLGEKAESLRQAIEQFRGAYAMYPSEGPIIKGTKAKVEKCAKEIGLDLPISFLLDKVFFDVDLGGLKTDERLCYQFVGLVGVKLPKWANMNPLGLAAAYRAIAHLINKSIRKTLSREVLERTIQETIALAPARFDREGVWIRLYHWEDPALDLSEQWDVLLDWSEYFDRINRSVPDSSVWQGRLLPDLEEAQKRIRGSTTSKLIRFRPSACLSAGFALGWAFSEVKGYTFEVKQGGDLWRTDVSPTIRHRLVVTEERTLDESSKDLWVELNQQVNVRSKTEEFVRISGQKFRGRIVLAPDQGVGGRIDGATALAYAFNAKQLIREAIDRYGCDTIHLFYAGPLGLAIFLGRLFNAMHANIQCYEEQNQGGYAPSCLLST